MAQRGPTRPTARIEEAIGFVGMFGVLFLGVTIFCEVTGRPALGWALTLLVAVVAVVLLDRWRVSVLRRVRAGTGEVDGVGSDPGDTPPVRSVRASGGHAHAGWDEVADGRRRARRAGRASTAASRAVHALTAAHASDARRPTDG
ncbi:hypothetical protein [Curtobacterium sp. DN_7.5]|uniref:hypothetical protein n=1 Tax=Curtobacterium sp. DN_7.5 TaxID=3049047 RepID=UPI001F57A801|nr:hypothetical protein [Curtobacterium sp. DN_7.5]